MFGTLLTPRPSLATPADTFQAVERLRDGYLERAHPKRLSSSHPMLVEITSRHAEAVASGVPCYLDPTSGFSVFTADFLAERGMCCESGCRHCPFDVDD
jgi:hypothetical protein